MPMASWLPERERRALVGVASQLWRAAQRGLVHLVQRRLGSASWTYIAIARPPRRNTSNKNSSLNVEISHVEA
jgi:hypothetical protein